MAKLLLLTAALCLSDAIRPSDDSSNEESSKRPAYHGVLHDYYRRERNCSAACLIHEYLKGRRLARIKEAILAELRLEQPPNVTGTRPPQPLLDNILSSCKVPEAPPTVRVPKYAVKSIVTKKYNFAERAPERLNFPPDMMRSYFNLDSLQGYTIAKAILYGFIKAPEQLDTAAVVQKLDVHVYAYSSPTEIQSDPIAFKSLEEDLRVGQWETFDISEVVKKWAKIPAVNYGLMLKAELNSEDLIWRHSDSDASKLMFIEIHVEEQQIRSTVKERIGQLDCDENSQETKCCRYPLEVNFESFGWDWIIAPKRYNAYYCAGTCPYLHEIRYPVSHLLQQHVEQQNLGSNPGNKWGSVGPCCSPHHMKEMKIIYYNEHREIIERTIPDMIVEKCSCG